MYKVTPNFQMSECFTVMTLDALIYFNVYDFFRAEPEYTQRLRPQLDNLVLIN